MVATDSALALPDQDQAQRRQRGAVAGPLDLPDHEARLWPVDRAGALADPKQACEEREQTDGQKQSAHGSSVGVGRAAIAQRKPEWRASEAGARAAMTSRTCAAPSMAEAQKSPGPCRGFCRAEIRGDQYFATTGPPQLKR